MKHVRTITPDAPVAQMDDMTGLPGIVIACLRHWNRGGAAAALGLLRAHMSEATACASFEALQDLTDVLGPHIRRPLRCHAPQCQCVGLDEAAFARFVEEAALGEREEALMLASLLVAPRGIMPLADAAHRLGLTLHRAVLQQRTQGFPDPANQTRH
ncbi:hypothetical protein ROTO_16930 [Roseovarius tolerans]|uniref:Uncharacterized protein n=1 Tax=Roseovarius tolerans TaxID=74031 RepID=A0A0L6CVC6_9RHOB|nr:hypothetical protein [Roseovarius tolerans]KNX41722.1 hypothetical protein ROTO_16930 [Roseovarius tolerans]